MSLSFLFVAAAVLSACGSSSSSTTPTATTPAAPATTPSTTPASAPATTTSASHSASSSSGVDLVPVYRPSSRVRRNPGYLLITTPDSVAKVGAFYSSTFAGGGWVTVSKTVTRHGASFTVKKDKEGATVVVSPNGSGSLVAITASSSP